MNNEINNKNRFFEIYKYYSDAFNYFNKYLFNDTLVDLFFTIEKITPRHLGKFFYKRFSCANDELKSGIVLNLNHLNLFNPIGNFNTILHEMVHFDAYIKKEKSTVKGFHNEIFKKKMEQIGFVFPNDPDYKYGWTFCEPNADLIALYDSFKETHPISFETKNTAYLFHAKKNSNPPKKTRFKYSCKCHKTFTGKKGISAICKDCSETFEIEDEITIVSDLNA